MHGTSRFSARVLTAFAFVSLTAAVIGTAAASTTLDASVTVSVGDASASAHDDAAPRAAAPAPLTLASVPVPSLRMLTSGSGSGDAGANAETDADGGAADDAALASPDADAASGEPLTQGVVAVSAGPAGRAVAGAAALLLFEAAKWLAAGAVGLYARIGKGEVLNNEVRDRVYKTVQADPGISVSALQERLGLGWGTTVYHLDRLERNGFVTSERSGLHRAYFGVGGVRPDERPAVALMRKEPLARLASRVMAAPGSPQGEIAATLGLKPSAAAKQFAKLEGAGLIRREREGRVAFVHPTASLGAFFAPGESGAAAAFAEPEAATANG